MTKLRAFVAGSLFGALAVFLLIAADKAKAQEPTAKCGPRAALVQQLTDKYHEVPVSIGMINEELIMETFASTQGTWTVFLTNTEKVSCMVADGINWEWNTKAFDDAKKGPEF